jgi:predicted ATPase
MMTDVDNVSETWVNEITDRGEKISDLVLMDKRTKTPVSHRDVGIGVSQVIPILVSCYGLSDAFVAIEQPEIHLHPKLQAELGDVFIQSALGEQKNTFILETHSEHLLLRIMRRMRETYNNELPEGCLPVRPEDVSVLFVESDSRGSFVREMPLNKRGELVKAWPGGFFEEELDEIF